MSFDLGDAIKLAVYAHAGQKDKVGEDYILHPLRVMMSFPTYKRKQRIAAVLHDVLEDTALTAEFLLRLDIDPDIVQAIVALTYSQAMKKSGTTYQEFIASVAKNEIAREVKIADITDNTSLERLIRLDSTTQDRLLKKYKPALQTLESYMP